MVSIVFSEFYRQVIPGVKYHDCVWNTLILNLTHHRQLVLFCGYNSLCLQRIRCHSLYLMLQTVPRANTYMKS